MLDKAIFAAAIAMGLAAVPTTSFAQTDSGASRFVTLGTQAGGVPAADRSQPANLLRTGDNTMLIDAGSGVVQQLAKADVAIGQVDTVFISHLHFDHTGGLFGLLGLRCQVPGPGTLTIYGPPGTAAMVEGLLAAMEPAAAFMNAGRPASAPPRAAGDGITVVELVDGDEATVGEARVTAATNSHYGFPEDSPEAAEHLSLSFRFDLPDRSLGFTGDTGPSENMERLFQNVDLLVSEVMDPDAELEIVKGLRPDLPAAALDRLREHFIAHHLTPEAVGELAAAVKAKSVVLSHNALGEGGEDGAKAAIAEVFQGPVHVANDLDTF